MGIVGRRSVLRFSSGPAMAGTLVRPYADTLTGGTTPPQATGRAPKRLPTIFTTFPIQQA